LLLALAACTRTVYVPEPNPSGGPSVSRDLFPAAGATSFITANDQEQLSEGTGATTAGARNSLASDGDAAAGTPATPQTPPQSGTLDPLPPPDPTRTIVEGDIFHLEGTTLYVLHRYRGLLLFDVSDPDHIKLLGRLPFQAMPVEMYVRDGRAYAVVSDYFTYWQYDKDADPLGFHGSMVLIADVSVPQSPLLLGKLTVNGEVSDTRMVGDVLYVVSKRNPNYWRYDTADWEDTTWVVSLNVADPSNIHEVGRLEFPGASTVMHVYNNAIYVAANDPNQYLVDPAHENETLVTIVDISDPAGAIRKRGSLYVPGFIADKFKMDYDNLTLRVFSQRSLDGSSDGYVHTVDVTYPDQPRLLTSLDLSASNYGWLAATRMDANRGYALTQRYDSGRSYNELHVLDLSNPQAPTHTGSLLLPGTVSYFETRGDRLLAMGQTYNTDGTWTSYASVSLLDVSNPAAPRLMSTARLGYGFSYSLANSDYKALRVVDSLGLILVPLTFYDGSTSFNGIQILDLGDSAVHARGVVPNASTVERAFPVGDRLVSLSQQQLQVIDARDRDNPVITASMNLVRNVLGLWNIQGREVQLIGEVLEPGSRFEVIPFGREDDAPSLATLSLPYPSAPIVFRDGDLLRLIGWETNAQTVRNADFSDPLHPRLRGQLQISSDYDRIYNQGFSFYYLYWSPWAGLPLENRIIPVTERRVVDGPDGRRDFQSWLRLIDLRDADNPRVANGEVPMPNWPFVNKVTHGTVLHSSHVEETKTDTGTTLLFHVKSFLDRVDVSDPDNPAPMAKVNIPGYLVDVSDDGKVAFTIDYQWDEFGRRRNSLDMLLLDGDTATLSDVLPVSDQVNRAVFRDRTIWLTTHKYPWWGVHSDTIESRQPYTILSRVDVDLTGRITGQTSAKLAGYHFDLLDVEGSNAYLSSDFPYGVLVLDVTNPASPAIRSNARTIDYVSKVVPLEDKIYMPLGWFGVHIVSR
jgi:hypothetical protein